MDVYQHPRHLPEGSKEFVDLPAQPGLFHCIRHLGIGRTQTPIWTGVGLLSVPLCHHHRCLFAIPLLVMATMASEVQGQIYQHSDRPEWRWVYPPSHWHQLLFLVRVWIHLPILDQAEELFVVVEVQLHHKCCIGLRYVCNWVLSTEARPYPCLQTGTVFCFIFIFFTLQYPKGGVTLSWWGNSVWKNSKSISSKRSIHDIDNPLAADYNRTALLPGPVPQT